MGNNFQNHSLNFDSLMAAWYQYDCILLHLLTVIKLNKLFCAEHDAILYEYDFGDGWEHKIVLEKIHPFEKDIPLPVCKKGKRSCPPEDCGGIWGYQDFLDIIQDSSHAEYEETMEWIGGEFDPESFDIEKVNSILAEYCRWLPI